EDGIRDFHVTGVQTCALPIFVGLAAQSELAPERLAEPEAVLSGGLPRDLVELAGWMASEYCSTPARALGLMLAPGALEGLGTKRDRKSTRLNSSHAKSSYAVS